jgi:5'-nucleotidase / UDP-sugar diphosphatase
MEPKRNDKESEPMKRTPMLFVSALVMFLAIAVAIPATGHQEEMIAPDLAVINLADLHSAYDTYPALVTAATEVASGYGVTTEVVFLINGDLFELGVVVAQRSNGTADWEFVRRLSKLGTVVINIGNHEFDFMGAEEFVEAAEGVGAHVIGTVGLTAADEPLTPVSVDIEAAGRLVRFVGVGTDQLNTYPQSVRDSLSIPEPTGWVAGEWNRATGGADHVILATHAGLVADLAILETVASSRNLLYVLGGHDHLFLRERVAGTPYIHTGFRGEGFTVAEVDLRRPVPRTTFRDLRTTSVATPDPALTRLITRLRDEYLTPEDRAVVGVMADDLTVLEAAMWSVEQVRAYTGADVAFLNHTSFGAGLPAGELERYRFDQFMRFDNDVMRATVDARTLRTILERANQHEITSLADRTGDFLYAGPVSIRDGAEYEIVTSSWVALDFNQMRYLGVTVEFEKVPDITTKGILAGAMGH